MAPDPPNPFLDFATRQGLRIVNEDLVAAPRDVLASPADRERHILVTLSGRRADVKAVKILFITDASDPRPPSMRDVLWWLASDSWAVEQANGQYPRWAESHGYASDDPATLRVFRQHVRQAASIAELIGQEAYTELRGLYETEVRARG